MAIIMAFSKPLLSRFIFRLTMGTSSIALAVCMNGNTVAQPTSLTINANQRRTIGGVSTLDRDKYFNHAATLFPPANSNLGNLRQEVYSATGLNLTPGRGASEFDQSIGQGLPEDPTRPGFIDPTALRNELQGPFKIFATNSSRWEAFRSPTTDPLYIMSGRAATFFPSYFRQGEVSSLFPNRNAYAEFLNTFLDEAVYGPNAFLPVDQDRFHVEIINEPDLHIPGIFGGPSQAATLKASSEEMATYHREIAQAVKSVHPSASIGGPSLAVTDFSGNDYLRWENTFKPFIEGAGADLDFYSIHPYERYDVQSDGSVRRAVDQSPGRIRSQLDMIVNQQEQTHGNRLPISLTEFSSFNRGVNGSMENGSYAGYARDEQQWDQSRNFREQLLLYVNRPDDILNAVQFVYAKHFTNDVPTRDSADNVLYEQDSNGDYIETVIAKTYRMYAPIDGDYINVEGSTGDLQMAAFRDGDTVYLMLNNLLDTDQQLDLDFLMDGLGSIDSASISRIYRDESLSTPNVVIQDQDITNSYGDLILNPKEGAVLTFNVSGDAGLTTDVFENTYYGDQVAFELNDSGQMGLSPEISIDADTLDAISAKLRVGYTRSGAPEQFSLLINDNSILVPGGQQGVDDEEFDEIDSGLISREIDVPVEYLVDGVNRVRMLFGDNGFISSVALQVTTSDFLLGDFDRDGDVDADDIDFYSGQLGQEATGELAQLDLDGDGDVTLADHDQLVNTLVEITDGQQGTFTGDITLDGIVDVLNDAAILVNNLNGTGTFGYAQGDLNADGTVDVLNDAARLVNNLGSGQSASAAATSIPEPTAALVMQLIVGAIALRRRRV